MDVRKQLLKAIDALGEVGHSECGDLSIGEAWLVMQHVRTSVKKLVKVSEAIDDSIGSMFPIGSSKSDRVPVSEQATRDLYADAIDSVRDL